MFKPDDKRRTRESIIRLIDQVDTQPLGSASPDSVPSGFRSLDRLLGGGFRKKDLVVLGGDVGAGKSALALAIAVRAATEGHRVTFVSGEMDADRLMERALAIEGKIRIDEIRAANLKDEPRASIGAAAVRLQRLPLTIEPVTGRTFDEILEPAWTSDPELLIVDYLQLLPPPATKQTLAEDDASTLRALKAVVLERDVTCLALAQLPGLNTARADPRPTLDDFGASGAVKQHADTILALYREEMYRPEGGVLGAAELIVSKNRNGPTGFVDLYFHQQWMRFEDMLDPA